MAKVILITGASTGIGKATALYFKSKGWHVAATMRSPEKCAPDEYKGIELIKLDVTDNNSIDRAIREVIQKFGHIDVVVNNAGYGLVGVFEAAEPEKIKQQFDTNVFGLMSVIGHILPHFRAQKSGVIINIASVGGRITFPLYSLYHGTKWAVEGFSEALHFELRGQGIKVKIIEPGPIKTDFYSRSQDLVTMPGLDAYDDYVKMVYPRLQEVGAGAVGPEVVARTIYKAANDNSYSKMRYPVGGNAGLLLLLRRIIPHALFFRIVRLILER